MEELTLTTPALLFSAVFIDFIGLHQPFLIVCPTCAPTAWPLRGEPFGYHWSSNRELTETVEPDPYNARTGYCKSFSLRSQYVSYLYRTAIIFCLRIRTGTDSVDSLSRRIFPRNTDFHPFIGDLLGNDGEREKPKITRLTIPPIKFYQDTTRQGRMTVKRLPLPTSDLRSILPPSFSIIYLTNRKPQSCSLWEFVLFVETAENHPLFFAWNTSPSIFYINPHMPLIRQINIP